MVYCSQCGSANPPDAAFCTKCGARLQTPMSELERNLDHVGKEMGDLGRRLDYAFRDRRFSAETRYDRTFGVFGPLISSVIGFIILVAVIALLEALSAGTPIDARVAGFLRENLVLFFGLMIVGGYASYASRKYPPFRWVSPLIGAGIFYIIFLLVSRFITGLSHTYPALTNAAQILSFLVIPLTLLILVLGYLAVIGSLFRNEPPLPPQRPRDVQPPSYPPPPPPPSQEGMPPQRLYRSGTDRILGGVCGGLAGYFHVDPVIVRILFIIGTVLSLGILAIGYVVLWVIIPPHPQQAW